MRHRRLNNDLCHGPLLLQILLFALPLMASGLLQQLYNVADMVVIGQCCSDESLAAVTSPGSLIALIINMFLGLSSGVASVTARYIGAHEYRAVEHTVHSSMLLGGIVGGVLMLFGVFAAYPLLGWMSTPPEVIRGATLYMQIYFLGAPAVVVYNMGAAILRAVGDTKRPLFFLTAAGLLNVALNLLLVLVFRLDVAGVAIATTASQYLSAVLVVLSLLREGGVIHLDLHRLRFHKKELTEVLAIGIPSGIQSCSFQLCNVLIQSSINGFGKIAVAANGAAAKLEDFVYIPMSAFYHAVISFAAQNYGGKQKKRLTRVLWYTQGATACVGLLLGGIIFLFPAPLLHLITPSSEVVAAGISRLRIIGATCFICGFMDNFTGFLRGIGRSVVPTSAVLVGVCGFRILWIFTVFSLPQYHILPVLYCCWPISWVLVALFELTYYLIVKRRLFASLTDVPDPPVIPDDPVPAATSATDPE